jgi:hypothetical protein
MLLGPPNSISKEKHILMTKRSSALQKKEAETTGKHFICSRASRQQQQQMK